MNGVDIGARLMQEMLLQSIFSYILRCVVAEKGADYHGRLRYWKNFASRRFQFFTFSEESASRRRRNTQRDRQKRATKKETFNEGLPRIR